MSIATRRLFRAQKSQPVVVDPNPTADHVYVSTTAQLTQALTDAVPGQIIHLADGTYSGPFTMAQKVATAANPIILEGTSGATLNYASQSGFTFHLDQCEYVTLRGFQITGSQKSFVGDECNNCTLDGLIVHDMAYSGIMFRNYSCDNIIKNCEVYNTGQGTPDYGEGIYIGLAVSNWSSATQSRTGGSPDTSDRNQIINNYIHDVTAECIDIKEGVSYTVIRGNRFDGNGITGANFGDSWVDIKGCYTTVDANTGTNSGTSAMVDGYQVHVVSGAPSNLTGNYNTFTSNISTVNATGYAINVQSSATGNVVRSSNTQSGAGSGLTNISVT